MKTATRDVAVRAQPPPPTKLRDTPAGRAAVWAGRTWWHHKLRLMPLSVAAVGLAGAGMLHQAGPTVAGFLDIGAASVATGAIVGHRVWRRRNDRALNGPQTAYIAACSLSLGVFETEAVVGQPFTGAGMAAYGVVAAGASVAWWLRGLAAPDFDAQPQDQQRDSTEQKPAVLRTGDIWAKRIGCPSGPVQNSTLTKIEPLLDAGGNDNGETGIITLNADGGPIRHSAADVTPQLPKIAVGFDVKPANVAIEPIGPSKLRLMLFKRNPLTDPVLWVGPGTPGTYSHPAGMTPTGSWTHHPLVLPGWGAVHELIVGSTGSGKSRTARLRLAMARHTLNKRGEQCTASWLLDPHEGSSFAGWRDRVDAFARGDHQILAALAAAVVEKNRRLKVLSASGREVLRPSPDMPHIRILIDEFPAFILRCPQAVQLVSELVAEGRKVLIGLTVLTQYPTADKLGGDVSIRDGLLTTATVHRTGNQFSGMIVANGKQIGDPGALPLVWADGSSAAGVAYHLGAASDHSVMIRAAVGGLDTSKSDWEDDDIPTGPPYDEAWYLEGHTIRTEAGLVLAKWLEENPEPPSSEESAEPDRQQPWNAVLAKIPQQAGSTMWDKIELFLSNLGEEAGTGQICRGIGEDPDKKLAAVSQACSRAVDGGKLIKTDRGMWVLPQHAGLVGASR